MFIVHIEPHMRRDKRQKGSAIIETALILTPTIGMFVFILQMGVILASQQYYVERARAGARYAATAGYSSSDTSPIKNYVCYGSTTAAANGRSGLFGLKTTMVTVTRQGTAGTWNDRIEVTITGYSFASYIPWLSRTFVGRPIIATAPAQALGATT